MKISGNAIRTGNVIEHKGKLWRVLRTEHVKPGKGGAFLQAEMKSLPEGIKLNERFRASETVTRARLDQIPCQFLYGDEESLTFMNQQDFDQISVPTSLLGDGYAYLSDGLNVTIEFFETSVLSVILPEQITLEVVEADPVVKGQTAAASYKPAVLDNGLRTMVPPHIESGTRVVINTNDGSYVERAKN